MSTKQLRELEKLLKVYRKHPRSKIFAPLAEGYRKGGLVEEAIALCEKGLSFFPDYAGGKLAYSRALMEKGDFSRSKLVLEEIISLYPHNILAHKLLKKCCEKLGLSEEARMAQKRIAFLNPYEIISQEESSVKIEDSSFEAFEIKNIKSAFNPQESLPIDKNATQKKYMTLSFAELYEKQGLFEKALKVYHALLQKEPENKLIRNKYEEISKKLMDKNKNEEKINHDSKNSDVDLLKKMLSGIRNLRNV